MGILLLLTLQLALSVVEATNYKLQLGPLNFAFFDKKYVINADSVLFPYNNAMAYNVSITFKNPIANGLLLGIRMFIFRANAYRKFPYELDLNLCDTFRRNDFGIHIIYNISNFRGCPVQGNVRYYCNNFVVDPKKVPRDALIPGRFRVNVNMHTKAAHMADMEWFVEIAPDKHLETAVVTD